MMFSTTKGFSADCDRHVSCTVDIPGVIPNRIFTLLLPTIAAILHRAEPADYGTHSLVCLCRKFFMAEAELKRGEPVRKTGYESVSRTPDSGIICGGRLFAFCYARDNHHLEVDKYQHSGSATAVTRLIRIPPVLDAWIFCQCWFAQTTHGLYAFGDNDGGWLGLDSAEDEIIAPERVTHRDVTDVYVGETAVYLKTVDEWLGFRMNVFGQLGLGYDDDDVISPTPIPGSHGVIRWRETMGTAFAWTADGLMACGANDHGQCGVGSTDEVTTLTPVALPDDVKGRVDRVLVSTHSSFFMSSRRCLVAGLNRHGELGLGAPDHYVTTPTELLIPVDDIIWGWAITIVRSGANLLAFGNNSTRRISPIGPDRWPSPTPLSLPGPVTAVALVSGAIVVRLASGEWVGRGRIGRRIFARLTDERVDNAVHFTNRWEEVSDAIVESMSSRSPHHLLFIDPTASDL